MKNDRPVSRAPLTLMALVLMVLLFSLCTAVCVRVMVSAYLRSVSDEQRDMAALAAENAAEVLKSCGGDMSRFALLAGGSGDDAVTVYYDESWSAVSEGTREYTLTVTPVDSGEKYLGAADISVAGADGELFSLRVGWQEVDGNE